MLPEGEEGRWMLDAGDAVASVAASAAAAVVVPAVALAVGLVVAQP